MNEALWSGVLFLLTASALGLVLLPALVEWWSPRDAAPLLVVRRQDTNVRHFAESFRERVRPFLEEHGARARASGRLELIWQEHELARIVTRDAAHAITEQERAHALVRVTLMCLGDAELAGDIVYEREIYGSAGLRCAARTTLRAAYAARSIEFGCECVVARWVHAEDRIVTAPGCRLFGRASANGRILLAPTTMFERLNAPVIRCEAVATAEVTAPGFGRQRWRPPPSAVATAPSTYLIDGPLYMENATHLERNLVVRGPFTVASGTVIDGSIKAYGDIELGPGVVVRGAVVSHRNIVVGAGCRVRGPIISERTAYLRRGAIVGTPRLQTSVTAEDIVLEPGLQVSGTVWAHRNGVVAAGPPGAAARIGKHW